MRKDRVIKTKEILIFVFAYENGGKKNESITTLHGLIQIIRTNIKSYIFLFFT